MQSLHSMKASEIADVLERMGWEEIEIGGPHRYFNRPDGNFVWLPDDPDIDINDVDWFLIKTASTKLNLKRTTKNFTSRKKRKIYGVLPDCANSVAPHTLLCFHTLRLSIYSPPIPY